MNKKKYIYLELKETNGERTYYHRSVHEISAKKDHIKFASDYAKDFYGVRGEYSQKFTGWYFFAGELFIEIGQLRYIPQEDYALLNSYL